MKHHESLRIIMNYQSLLAVTIMNHCLERSDKSDMFGQATGTTCLCRGWSFISTTLLKKKTIAVCSNPKDSPWSPTSPIHATSHAVSGLKCLVSKDKQLVQHRACRWQAAAKLHKSLVSLGAQGAQQESTRCISLC